MSIYDALASAIYLARKQVSSADLADDGEKIAVSGLYDRWVLGSYKVGDIRNHGGQTWECFQAHDNAIYPDINPDNPAWYTFWRPLHGKSPETARPWVEPTGAHDIYRAGEYMTYESLLYLCKQDTNFPPDVQPGAWEKVIA